MARCCYSCYGRSRIILYMSELHLTNKTKLMVREGPTNSPIYLDRLKKIIKTPANERPIGPPDTLGSPSDRGPTQVPKIIKDDTTVLPDNSAFFTAMVGKAKKKAKLKK